MKYAWELVGEVVVGANTTQVDFTGLNFTKDDVLKLECDIIGAASASYYLLINGVDTLASYYRQYIGATSTTVAGSRQNNSELTVCDSGFKTRTSAIIRQSESGHVNALAKSVRHLGSTDTRIYDTAISMTAAQSGIQQIGVKVLTANAIGAGSVFRLYKLKAKKLADIVVGADTTQVDITGLNLTDENEVLLVCDVANASASGPALSLLINNNTTLTNYYSQKMQAEGSTISAARANSPTFLDLQGGVGQKTFGMANIKILNSGYVAAISDMIENPGLSTVHIRKYRTVSTFTVSGITQIAVQSSVANAIAAGSRFILYQLK